MYGLFYLCDRYEMLVSPNLLPFPRLLYLSHYSHLAAHIGERCMYNMMRRELYWPHGANDADKKIGHCCDFVRKYAFSNRKAQLKLFPAQKANVVITMDTLDPLRKTETRNQFIIVIDYGYMKLTGSFPSQKTIVQHFAYIFHDYWIVPYRISAFHFWNTRYSS